MCGVLLWPTELPYVYLSTPEIIYVRGKYLMAPVH
jgi:hypothetical protein